MGQAWPFHLGKGEGGLGQFEDGLEHHPVESGFCLECSEEVWTGEIRFAFVGAGRKAWGRGTEDRPTQAPNTALSLVVLRLGQVWGAWGAQS